MNITPIIILSLIVPIIVLLVIIGLKIIRGNPLPSSDYTPFDYITGHTSIEFQDQKQDQEEDDDQGDDKHKNKRYPLR